MAVYTFSIVLCLLLLFQSSPGFAQSIVGYGKTMAVLAYWLLLHA